MNDVIRPARLMQLPANLQGRDFLIGDLHGMYSALMRRLDAVRFDPAAGDRLLSTGDLVDRGPESLDVLRLLRAPWFHAVLGNHERILLAGQGWDERATLAQYARMYSRWVKGLSARQREELMALLPDVAALPWMLWVGKDTSDAFKVVHAEQRCRLRLSPDAHLPWLLEQGSARTLERLTWSRQLALRAIHRQVRQQGTTQSDGVFATQTPWVPGIDLTYVGHTVVPQAILHRSHLFIDRGGCFVKDEVPHPRWDLLLLEHRPRRLLDTDQRWAHAA